MICPFIFLIIVKLLIKITIKFFQSNINFNIYVKTLSYSRHKVFCFLYCEIILLDVMLKIGRLSILCHESEFPFFFSF